MTELGKRFEQQSGHRLNLRFEFAPVLLREIDAGAQFDVAVLSYDVADLIARGKLAAGTRTLLGRTGIGIGVPAGRPQPDIGTVAALTETLLAATSIAHSGGSSGEYFLKLLDRLGLTEAMEGKLRPQPPGGRIDAVARGEVELAVIGNYIVVATPGVDLVGWLPDELQNYIVFSAGLSTAAQQPETGRAFLDFLGTPENAAFLKAKGLEPPSSYFGFPSAPKPLR
jgi:molybdate transport system substrate-binding protein